MPEFLPTERSGLFDPPAELASLRREALIRQVVYPDGRSGWLITSYSLGRAVLGDARFGKEMAGPEFLHHPGELVGSDPASAKVQKAWRAGNFLLMDPPEHTRFRRLLAPHFTVRAIRQLEPRIREVVEAQLGVMEARGPTVDLIETFALPVPLRTICHLLGIPETEGAVLHRVTAAHEVTERVRALQAHEQLIRRLIRQKRMRPVDDLLSSLAVSGTLTEDEQVGVSMILAITGFHTSAATLAYAALALLADPPLWSAIASGARAIDTAVEELIRFLTPNQFDAHARRALEDVEIGGVVIKAGERVHVSAPAANRDDEKFAVPDAIDLGRDARGQLAFGHGIHICIGQHLARLEIQLALAGLARRFPNLRLAVPAEEVAMASDPAPLAGPLELPVRWLPEDLT